MNITIKNYYTMKTILTIIVAFCLLGPVVAQDEGPSTNFGKLEYGKEYTKTMDTRVEWSCHMYRGYTLINCSRCYFELDQISDVLISSCHSEFSNGNGSSMVLYRINENSHTKIEDIGDMMSSFRDEIIDLGWNVCEDVNMAEIAETLGPGKYYVDVGGYDSNGVVHTTIISRRNETEKIDGMQNPIDLGCINDALRFNDAKDTRNYKNSYSFSTNDNAGDIVYRFNVRENMDVSMFFYNANYSYPMQNTYMDLLDGQKQLITRARYSNEVQMPDGYIYQSVIISRALSPGTYYLICSTPNTWERELATIIENKNATSSTLPTINPTFSTEQNYIYTWTMTNEEGTSFIETIKYFDGLGYPMQTVQKGITPNRADLVALQEYDNFGRESNTWLPGVFAGNNGVFVANPKQQIIQTYGNDINPHSRTDYGVSPLNRIEQQYGPGQEWQNNRKAIKTEYSTNKNTTELRCVRYSVDGSGISTTLKANSYYTINQLFVTKITDEDGNLSYEFKDKQGLVLLTRQKNGMDYYDTYYVYDDFGNLCYVLPPMTNLTITPENGDNNDALKKFAYIYKYDERKRCIWKKLPGCEPIYMIYDKADRLIFSQDGEQRLKNQWLFSIPDVFGRVVLTGTCKNNLDYSTNPLQSTVVKAEYSNTAGMTYQGYNIFGVTLTTPRLLIVNYYDNYDFISKVDYVELNYVTQTGFNTQYTPSAKGLITGTIDAEVSNYGAYLCNYKAYYYDYCGRLIQTQAKYIDYDYSEYTAYNFTGQLVEKKTELKNFIMEDYPRHEHYKYDYDHAGRLLKTSHKMNNGVFVVLTDNTYDELGRLKTAMPNNRQDLKLTYDYNIRSWLTKISGQKFLEKLYYNTPFQEGTARWNGNISSMETSGGTSAEWGMGYNYFYDNLSRLTDTQSFFTDSGGGVSFGDDYFCSGGYGTHYNYDKNGNMNYLFRLEDLNLENISIGYNGNQIKNITTNWITEYPDEHPCHSDNFTDYSQGVGDYVYDRNGAMTEDPYKGAKYSYNTLGMLTQVDVSAILGTINYVYSSTGEKMSASYQWNSGRSLNPIENTNRTGAGYSTPNSSKDRLYIGNKIYENGRLKQILFDNGYCDASGNYYFYLRDHLGNNCVVAKSNGQVVQSSYYFPYGKVNNNESGGQSAQPYKFGGKEEELMFGLGLYDFHARQMDQAVPRFMSIDPKAEKYYSISPYAYCANNPIRFIDKDGKDLFDYRGDYMTPDYPGMIYVRSFFGQDMPLSQFSSSSLNAGPDGNVDGAVSKIATYYARQMGYNDVTIGVKEHYKKYYWEALAFTDQYGIFLNKKGGQISPLLDYIDNMKSTIFHEYDHWTNKHYKERNFDEEQPIEHAKVYLRQIQDKSFINTTEEYKLGTFGSFKKYLENSKPNERMLEKYMREINNAISPYNYRMSPDRTYFPDLKINVGKY